jgi:hypothetical protein
MFITRNLKEAIQGLNSMIGANLPVKWFIDVVQIRHRTPVINVDQSHALDTM